MGSHQRFLSRAAVVVAAVWTAASAPWAATSVARAQGGDGSTASSAPEEARVTLVYERAPGAEACPDQETFRALVEGRLGYLPFVAVAARVVTVRLSPGGPALRAELSIADMAPESSASRDADAPSEGTRGRPVARRELVSAGTDCVELATAAANAVSIAIDPFATMGGPGNPRPAAAAGTSPPAAEIRVGTAAPSADARAMDGSPVITGSEPSVHPDAMTSTGGGPGAADAGTAPFYRAGLAADIGLAMLAVPGASVALGADLVQRMGRLTLSTGVTYVLPRGSDARSGPRVEAALILGTVRACLAFGVFAACGVVHGGAMEGEGSRIDEPLLATTPYLAAGPAAGATFSLARGLDLRLLLELPIVATPTSLRLNDAEVWSTSPLTVGLGASLMAFP